MVRMRVIAREREIEIEIEAEIKRQIGRQEGERTRKKEKTKYLHLARQFSIRDIELTEHMARR